MRMMYGLCLIGFLLLPVHPAAHPGHDDDEIEVLYGTVTGVRQRTIELEIVDRVAMALKTVSILVDEETEFLEGKTPVETLDLDRGDRVECTVRVSHAPDGSDRYRAVKIRRK